MILSPSKLIKNLGCICFHLVLKISGVYDAPGSELVTQVSFSLLELDNLGGSCLMLQRLGLLAKEIFVSSRH